MNQVTEKPRGLPKWVEVILISAGTLGALYLLSVWVLLNVLMIDEPKPIQFNQSAWQSPDRGKQTRHAMLGDLIAKHKLVGMTRSEIEALLGKPDWPGRGWYKLGPQLGVGIDDIWLELTYEDGVVIKHEIKYD
jgi:hypothetical protein